MYFTYQNNYTEDVQLNYYNVSRIFKLSDRQNGNNGINGNVMFMCEKYETPVLIEMIGAPPAANG